MSDRTRPAGPRARRALLPGDGEERLALAGVVFLLGVTAAWWALALWPLPHTAPAWLERAQAVCFNLTDAGIPDASGWLLLAGQPLAMMAALAIIAGRPLRAGLGKLARSPSGRAHLLGVALLLAGGTAAAGARVAGALRVGPHTLLPADLAPEDHPRLALELPAFALLDQHGVEAGAERIRGRPAFVTFAFGHCETVCPLLVRSALEARDRLEGEPRLAVIVITLDPWRDTPDRLPVLASGWGLGKGDLLLGGSVEAVEDALDAWKVARSRDLRTGDVAHAPLTYVVDGEGRIAFAARGDVATLTALAGRLQ